MPALYAFPLFSAPTAATPSLLPVAWLHASPGDIRPALLGSLLAVTRTDALSGQYVTTAFRPDERQPTWTAADHIDGLHCVPLGGRTLHADAHGQLLTRDASGHVTHRTALPAGMDLAPHLPFLSIGEAQQPDLVIIPCERALVGFRTPEAPAWTWTSADELQAVAVDGSLVYTATTTHLMAVDGRSGRTLWQRALPGNGRLHLSAHGAYVFVARDGGQIQAFTATGRAAWQGATGNAPITVFSAAADVLLLALSGSTQLIALDACTGERRWAFAGEQACTAALVVGGAVYAAFGRLHALCADTGTGFALSGLFPHIPGHVSTPHLTVDPVRKLLIAWASTVPAAQLTRHAS